MILMTLKINLLILIGIVVLAIAAGAMIGYSLDFLIRKRNDLSLEEENEEDQE